MDAGPGAALFRLVRFWSRRWAYGMADDLTGDLRHVQSVAVVEALSAAERMTPEVTVGSLAYQLGVDRSVVSRMVAEAVETGYVSRRASPDDGRRQALSLTDAGWALLGRARAWQEDVFSSLTENWAPEDRQRFGGYLLRLADDVLREST